MGEIAEYYSELYDSIILVQKEEKEVCIRKRIWQTSSGEKISVKDMTKDHINNTIKAFISGKISEVYFGGKEVWLKIFKKELKSRNSHVA